MRGGRALYILQGGLAGFFFGTSAIFIRFLPKMDAFMIGFYRLILATAFLLPFLTIFLRGVFFEAMRRKGRAASLLGLIIGGHFAAYILSVKHTTVMNATVLTNTTPIFAALLSWLIYGVKPGKRSGVGVAMAFGGMLLVVTGTTGGRASAVGDLEALLAAVLWALYMVFGKSVRRDAHPLALMIPIYAVSAAFLALLGLAAGDPRLPHSTELPAILGLAILPTALGHTLSFSSLKGLQPYQTAVLALLEPIVATGLAVVLFSEIPATLSLAGSAIVLAAIYLVTSAKR